MAIGRRSGGSRALAGTSFGVGLFVADDGGYTTVAVAVALLLSLTLAFGVAAAGWSAGRAADVQSVADAAALAGSNCVAAYTTVAQVLDACVLSMGLLGTIVFGAGMILAAIPAVQAASPTVIDAGKKILDARRKFAHSASQGLARLEGALPALVAANSASTVSANSRGDISYAGLAVPFPPEGESDFTGLEDELDSDEMERAAEDLRRASEEKAAASARAAAARERAWRADCVDDPMCMRSRAEDLAGLYGATNPDYPSASAWRFDYARARAANYYAARSANEQKSGDTPDDLQRSCARARFFRYAYDKISSAVCVEGESVSIDLPDLPHTTDGVKGTELYTERVWPCTMEDGRRVLHCSTGCPAARGESSGEASLREIDAGSAARCETCRMDAVAMGNVADASTNIGNGFEHYWRILVEASREYQDARRDEAEKEREMQDAAEKSGSAFDRAMKMLAVERPGIKPPGHLGCMSFVMRGSETAVPNELVGSFVSGGRLPAGAAISAATLAPDEATDGHDVLSSVFDGISEEGLVGGLLDGVTGLWGRLLVSYGSAYGSVSEAAGGFLDGVGDVFGEKVASWLRKKVSDVIDAAGFEPTDMRLRKPVLTNTQNVMDGYGGSQIAEVRNFVETLPEDPDAVLAACRDKVRETLGQSDVTVAEIPVPGLDGVSIPLTINLGDLMGVFA
ncbi:MAG: hypothetical protein J6D54_07125 [Olsenella sp.]|nr:hypothetical protein [Olsenella sp.]